VSEDVAENLHLASQLESLDLKARVLPSAYLGLGLSKSVINLPALRSLSVGASLDDSGVIDFISTILNAPNICRLYIRGITPFRLKFIYSKFPSLSNIVLQASDRGDPLIPFCIEHQDEEAAQRIVELFVNTEQGKFVATDEFIQSFSNLTRLIIGSDYVWNVQFPNQFPSITSLELLNLPTKLEEATIFLSLFPQLVDLTVTNAYAYVDVLFRVLSREADPVCRQLEHLILDGCDFPKKHLRVLSKLRAPTGLNNESTQVARCYVTIRRCKDRRKFWERIECASYAKVYKLKTVSADTYYRTMYS
jgi:hypothetical protein